MLRVTIKESTQLQLLLSNELHLLEHWNIIIAVLTVLCSK